MPNNSFLVQYDPTSTVSMLTLPSNTIQKRREISTLLHIVAHYYSAWSSPLLLITSFVPLSFARTLFPVSPVVRQRIAARCCTTLFSRTSLLTVQCSLVCYHFCTCAWRYRRNWSQMHSHINVGL